MTMRPAAARLPAFALLVFLAAGAACAQTRGGKGDGETSAGLGVARLEHDVRATGLVPAFPPGFACTAIASPYAAPTRHDGSLRRADRNAGLHGGIDLTLAEGTPLLAVAAGELIAKGEGGRLEGIYLWLRHAPQDTGLPFWTFSKYQHLAAPTALEPGSRVVAGQALVPSGATGTAGPHYGPAGYPHLHLTTFYGPSGDFEKAGMFGSMVKALGAAIGDPLVLYLRGAESPDGAAGLPEERKRLAIPVMDDAGAIHPAGSLTVWPVACRRR